MQSIQDFLKKISAANRSQSKEIRITREEANQLATDISMILDENLDLSRKIIKLQEEETKPIIVSMDGGTF